MVFRAPGSAHNFEPSRCVTSVHTAYMTDFVCVLCVKCEISLLLVEIISSDNSNVDTGGIKNASCARAVEGPDKITQIGVRCNDGGKCKRRIMEICGKVLNIIKNNK